MQIRRLWHYVLGIICAIAFNGLLILLLIVASSRKQQEPPKKTSSYFGWLKLSQALKPIPQVKPQDTINDHTATCSAAPETPTQSRMPNCPQHVAHASTTIEIEDFFQKGQEILAELNKPKISAASSPKAKENSNEINNLDPAQFYVKNAINHIIPYRKTLYKKYAKLRRNRAEYVERQPNLLITIRKDGSLEDICLEKSSGSPTYDKYCIQAIKQAAPLPKIPDYLRLNHVILAI